MSILHRFWPVAGQNTTSPFFTKLPLEIRDAIYDYAYCDQDEQCLTITKRDWVRRHAEQLRFGAISQVPPFPTTPLSCMTASKAFYNEAGSAWLRCVTLRAGDSVSMKTLLAGLTSYHKRQIRKLSFGLGKEIWYYNRLPNFEALTQLRELRITISDEVFRDCATLPCSNYLTDDDLATVPNFHDVLHLRQEAVVRLIPDRVTTIMCKCYNGNSTHFEQNVAALEAMVAANTKGRLSSGSSHLVKTETFPTIFVYLIAAWLILIGIGAFLLLMALFV